MMLLLGFLARESLVGRKPLDRTDHMLMWIIKICLVVLFLTLPDVVANAQEKDDPDGEFFYMCSGGELAKVKESLEKHPDWLNARTENGESCLHLTGIHGYSEVTKLLLEKGADPNIRSTYEQGLRMHPLSWNIYGGHVENTRLLLENGANVNADFDSMDKRGPVTPLDVALQLTGVEEGDARFVQIEKLLRKHGGKTMQELKEAVNEL